MKKIMPFIIFMWCVNASAAETPFGAALENNFNTYGYLTGVADAWAVVLNGVGRGPEIARKMDNAKDADLPAFYNMISVIGYNDTALTMFEVSRHIDNALSFAAMPGAVWRDGCGLGRMPWPCRRRNIEINGMIFGASGDFDSADNADFNVHSTGLGVAARAYVSNGLRIGVGYARTMTDTHDSQVYTDAISDSITLFAQYLSPRGLFMNAGISAGQTKWDVDKTIAGISDNGAFDTEFMAAMITGGVQIIRGRFFIVPNATMKYVWMQTGEHIDAAAQDFDKWWYNVLNGGLGMRMGFDFHGMEFVFRPNISIGGSFDIISRAPDDVAVRVVGDGVYHMPIIRPKRAAFNGGIGMAIMGQMFSVNFDYKMDVRTDYIVHTGIIDLKIAF